MPKISPIPTYGLFGETSPESPAGFAHIETIAARSGLHDWEISPHRHSHGVQILVIQRGHGVVTLDGKVFALPAPGFIALPAGLVHGFRFEPATQGHVLTLSLDFLTRARDGADRLRALLTLGGHGALEPAAAARIAQLADTMLALAGQWLADPALPLALAEAIARSLPVPSAEAGADARLARFRDLVEVHLREHRALDFYAAQLGCTVRTLTRLARAHHGASPLEIIHQRLALEARRLLRYTNANVTQVAEVLGFADPSYFSRFYLRMTGRRPQGEKGGEQEGAPLSR